LKINIELDCTPEEARRAIGLPDLTPIHDRYVAMMMETMQGHIAPETRDAMMRAWQPMGEAGMTFWKGLFDRSAGGTTGS
jgi:hypothetical protein